MRKRNKVILVVGSSGMLGRVVYRYFRLDLQITAIGAQKSFINKDSHIFKFDANNYKEDFTKIIKKIKKIDFVVNCIGKSSNLDSIQNLIYVNSLFPHKLEDLSRKYNFILFHVSTDAVFSNDAGIAEENHKLSPEGAYGASKLLGEIMSQNSLTFRTSLLGFDPFKHKGILEWILKNKDNKINGFINQKWSGCTALQFAKLLEDIIKNDCFPTLKSVSDIHHFAPLGPISKYALIKKFSLLAKIKNVVTKTKGEYKNRILKTGYFDYTEHGKYTHNIQKALQELLKFEETIKKHEEKT